MAFVVAGVLAVANISADPGVPVLAGVFTLFILGCTVYSVRILYNVYCSMRHNRLPDFRTIGLQLSDWRILETIGLSDIGSRPQSIGLSDIGLT
jgi:hypothetical protein